MGKTLLLLSLVVAGLCGSEVRGSVTSEPSPVGSAARTVVPGRTWWYSGQRPDQAHTGQWFHPVVGLRLASEREYDQEWLPCHAVASSGEKLFETPLATLKESDGKVWIRPSLDLSEVTAGMYEDSDAPGHYEMELLRLFLGYWDGAEISPEMGPEYSQKWYGHEDNAPLLLYDFSYVAGDCYEWPWTGMDCDFGTGAEYVHVDKGCYVRNVSETELADGTVVKSFDIVQHSKNPDVWGDTLKGTIVEGVGITEGEFCSYVPGYYGQAGFWIAPLSKGYYEVGATLIPYPPRLRSVVDADGSCVYGNPDFNPASVSNILDGSSVDAGTYDLQGRKVTNPERGLYVRGGQKVVVRR